MDKQIAELCIGTLLHDIGKISERAGTSLTDQSKRMQQNICPMNQSGHFRYQHAAHTSQFFEQIEDWLPRELEKGKIANIACSHHKPDAGDFLQIICQQADWLSAGQDRSTTTTEEYDGILDHPPSAKTPAQKVRDYAKSIFSSLPALGAAKTPEAHYWPLVPMDLTDRVFAKSSVVDHSQKDYQSLWQQLTEHFRKIEPKNPELAIEQILWIYRLYAWCVPSHRQQFQEISLLEHSLTAAAFACALYQYHRQTNTLSEGDIKNWETPKFLIVQGDLSGIQSYLYQTSLEQPAGLSRRLRAKSFYLAFVGRLAAMLLLERLGLPSVNRIIDGGGNFMLLAQNTEQAKQVIADTEKRITGWFRRTFGGSLHLNLSYDLTLCGEDFATTRFFQTQQRLAERMDLAKRRAQRAVLQTNNRWDDASFLAQTDSMLAVKDADAENEQQREMKLPANAFFEQLGSKLANGNVLVVSRQKLEGEFDNEVAALPLAKPLDAYYFAVTNAPISHPDIISCVEFVPGRRGKSLSEVRDGVFFANYVPQQTEQDRGMYQHRAVIERYSARIGEAAGGQATDHKDIYQPGSPKSFAHLALDDLRFDKDHNVYGADILAVLKADVDRLGMMLSKGLEKAQASLSYYICLSNQLDLFFSGIMPNMFLNPPTDHPEFRNIYTVYAGGDDLLLVGPWWTMFRFAAYLRDLFGRYVCNHPDITLSAGLAVCNPRLPLSQAARQAGEALKKAKQYKNRICVFDTVLTWKDFQEALGNAEFLDHLLNDNLPDGLKAEKAFLYRLLRYCKMAEACHPDPDEQKTIAFRNLMWRSHLKYDIARNIVEKAKDKEKKKENDGQKSPSLLRLEQMTELNPNDPKMNRLKIAVMCCLYRNRDR